MMSYSNKYNALRLRVNKTIMHSKREIWGLDGGGDLHCGPLGYAVMWSCKLL